MVKWQIFRNFIVANQLVMNKIKPLDQLNPTGAFAPSHIAKLQNKSETRCNILDRLMDFAVSVPDFRRTDKGNIRHRLEDIIMLMVLARASKCVGRAEIIEFGRHNLNRLRKIGMFRNGVPSEATLCRMENGINDPAMADSMQEFARKYHGELLEELCIGEIICIDGKTEHGTVQEKRAQSGYRVGIFFQYRHHAGYRGMSGKKQRDKGCTAAY